MVKLEEFLERGGNWKRKRTSIAGLSVIKMPPTPPKPVIPPAHSTPPNAANPRSISVFQPSE